MAETRVVSIKVPADLQAEVRKTRADIDWPEEIRRFIRERLMRWKAEQTLNDIRRRHAGFHPQRRGTAAALVREDRDRH